MSLKTMIEKRKEKLRLMETNPIYFTRTYPIELHDTRRTTWEHCNAKLIGAAKGVAARRGHNQVGILMGDRVLVESHIVEKNLQIWRDVE